MQPTPVTWALVIFGVITMAPLILAQSSMLFRPDSQKTRNLLIGKGEDWRDGTHYRFSRGAAWADWLLFAPLFVAGCAGVVLGYAWGYVLFGVTAACSLYINIILWFTEKEYVYPTRGRLRYYTYYWGFFVYWGALAVVYSVLRIAGVDF